MFQPSTRSVKPTAQLFACFLTRTPWIRGCVSTRRSGLCVQACPSQQRSLPRRYLGQPSPHTHPHLLRPGEVTPALTQREFALRRHRLMALISGRDGGGPPSAGPGHVAVVLSHPTRYMANDIPYPFHQSADLLYLSGFLEPDSALVLHLPAGAPPAHHTASLFVPRRDPARELWDGPRSGQDGAAALTGLERVYPTEELGRELLGLKGMTLFPGGGGGGGGACLHPLPFHRQELHSSCLAGVWGEMVLLDGGCEYFGYVSDVTRTWPVNGRFSPPQAELYQAVLDIQGACLTLCSPGVSLDSIYSHMLRLLGARLKDLGIISSRAGDADTHRAARRYCPHHVGHYLGMDVHDTPDLSRAQPLRPGMA
uniref:X-prolyl aminopeptidase 3, mitochondrial n=1 Tax=Lepisosteus oculatus TaxID=7918 RepID=W5N0Q2_LEPOC